jgi:hypothetical protein
VIRFPRDHTVLDHLLVLAGIGGTLSLLLVALVGRAGDWPAQRFLLFYVAPVIGYAAAWARGRLAALDRDPPGLLALDAVAFVAGGLRAGGGWGVLPYSGHVLFLTFAAFTSGERSLRLMAIGLLLVTSGFKLALWHDWRSWSLGLAGGLALGLARRLLERRMHARMVRERPAPLEAAG